jgi:hypothetical protein
MTMKMKMKMKMQMKLGKIRMTMRKKMMTLIAIIMIPLKDSHGPCTFQSAWLPSYLHSETSAKALKGKRRKAFVLPGLP